MMTSDTDTRIIPRKYLLTLSLLHISAGSSFIVLSSFLINKVDQVDLLGVGFVSGIIQIVTGVCGFRTMAGFSEGSCLSVSSIITAFLTISWTGCWTIISFGISPAVHNLTDVLNCVLVSVGWCEVIVAIVSFLLAQCQRCYDYKLVADKTRKPVAIISQDVKPITTTRDLPRLCHKEMTPGRDHFLIGKQLQRKRRRRKNQQVVVHLLQENERARRKKSDSIKDIHRRGVPNGVLCHLVPNLLLDDSSFRSCFRVNRELFYHLVDRISPIIGKDPTYRITMQPNERLALTLRFLATGEVYCSLSYQFRIGLCAVSNIIKETCEAIWTSLNVEAIQLPQTEDGYKDLARDFFKLWDFPHCIGSIDGKHVQIQAPPNSEGHKGHSSVVLLAVVDAHQRFTYIDVVSIGANSNGGICGNSTLNQALNKLQVPPPEPLPDKPDLGDLPYVMVGDEAFPLTVSLMRPHPENSLMVKKREFNYRLSRARKTTEGAFALLASRFQLYFTQLSMNSDTIRAVVKATCVLHNLLSREGTPWYVQAPKQPDEEIQQQLVLEPLCHVGYESASEAIEVREKYTTYFHDVPSPGQLQYATRSMNK